MTYIFPENVSGTSFSIPIPGHQTKAVADMLRSGQKFDYVITVCHEASAVGQRDDLLGFSTFPATFPLT